MDKKDFFEDVNKENKKISSNSNEDKIFSTIEYENLFKPGGILYPVYLQELIPVESQMNNKNCQVCIPSEKIIKDIKNNIKSTYAIYEKSENLYDITMIMSQKDEKTEVILMQYCNIKIYI